MALQVRCRRGTDAVDLLLVFRSSSCTNATPEPIGRMMTFSPAITSKLSGSFTGRLTAEVLRMSGSCSRNVSIG
jgi:hypothetical protein